MGKRQKYTVVGFVDYGDGNPPVPYEGLGDEEKQRLASYFADKMIEAYNDYYSAHPEALIEKGGKADGK